eukprot:g16232.t1
MLSANSDEILQMSDEEDARAPLDKTDSTDGPTCIKPCSSEPLGRGRLRKAVGSVIFSNYWRPVARRTARRGRPGRRTSVRLCVWKGLNSEVRQFLGNFSVLALWGLASYPSPSKSLRSSAPPNRQLGAKMQGTF